MPYQKIYTSQRSLDVSKLCLASILKASRRNNPRDGITGLLLAESGSFFQVLEGDKDAVDRVFDRITADQRHADIHVILERAVENRNFGQWSMAFREIDTIADPRGCFELSRDTVLGPALIYADDCMRGLVMDFLAFSKPANRGDVELFRSAAC